MLENNGKQEERTMPDFVVSDMTCDGCVRAITQAVRSVDPSASVVVDLASKRVHVDSAAQFTALADAIDEAGFTVAAA
jgi:copper chaperone CopZ